MITHDPFTQSLAASLPRLTRDARYLTKHRHDAEDLVQQTALKAWLNRDKFTSGTNFFAWVRCLMRHTATDLHRRDGKVIYMAEFPVDMIPSLAATQETSRLVREVLSTVQGLEPDHREVISLVDIQGCSYGQAAAQLGVTEGTVKSRLWRARSAVKVRLGEVGVQS